MLNVPVVNKSANPLPVYQTIAAAGLDLMANIERPIELVSLERKLIPTGLFIELPDNYEAQIRPRSGLAIKHGITCLNSPGTVDADYRGKEKNIASILLETLENHAKLNGLNVLYLGTKDVLLAAQAFYVKKGFYLIDENELPAKFPRMVVDNRFFKKEL